MRKIAYALLACCILAGLMACERKEEGVPSTGSQMRSGQKPGMNSMGPDRTNPGSERGGVGGSVPETQGGNAATAPNASQSPGSQGAMQQPAAPGQQLGGTSQQNPAGHPSQLPQSSQALDLEKQQAAQKPGQQGQAGQADQPGMGGTGVLPEGSPRGIPPADQRTGSYLPGSAGVQHYNLQEDNKGALPPAVTPPPGEGQGGK